MQRRRVLGVIEKQAEKPFLKSEFIGYRVNDEAEEKLAYVVECDEEDGQHVVLFMNNAHEEEVLALSPENARVLTSAQIRRMCDPNGFDRSVRASLKREQLGEEQAQKRRRSSRIESINSADAAKREEMSRRALVGTCILIRLQHRKPRFYALVVGYQSPDLHKVYFFVDSEYDDVSLNTIDWLRVPKGMEPWDSRGLIACRLYFMERPDYLDSLELIPSPTPVMKTCPYEAFAVENTGPGRYKLFVTKKNTMIEKVLEPGSNEWDVIAPGVQKVKGKLIVSWSSLVEKV